MKLEVGKFYKDREGNKIEVIAIRDERAMTYAVSEKALYSYGLDGRFCDADNNDSQYDLIEEWQEPVVIEGWCNIYKNEEIGHEIGRPYPTKEEAAEVHNGDPANTLVCLHIKIDLSKPEGQRIWEVVE